MDVPYCTVVETNFNLVELVLLKTAACKAFYI